MQDLKSYGVQYVVPILENDGWAAGSWPWFSWNATNYNMPNYYTWGYQTSSVTSLCTGHPLSFIPWVPWGYDMQLSSTGVFQECAFDNRGYTSSHVNPGFWGWAATGNVISTIMNAVYNQAGLYMVELQLPTFMDVVDFPVRAHWVYDPTLNGGTDVLALLRSYAGNYASVLTFAAGDFCDAPGGTLDCASPWGGSARFTTEYAFIAMMQHQAFGWPNNACNSWGVSMLCATGTGDTTCSQGSHNTLTGLPTLPNTWSLPGTPRIGMFAHQSDLNFAWQTYFNLVTTYSNLGRAPSMSETYGNETVNDPPGSSPTATLNLINAFYNFSNVQQLEREMSAFAVWADAINWPPALNPGWTIPSTAPPPYPRYKCVGLSCPNPLSL